MEERREVPYNPTGVVHLTEAQRAAMNAVRTSMRRVSGVGSMSVRYEAILGWRDKRLHIEIISTRALPLPSATLKMWTNGGWQKLCSLPAEEVPDLVKDDSITVDDFEEMHQALVERAMAVLA